jgi:hypothetical protein
MSWHSNGRAHDPRGEYWEERVQMKQEWSDYLDRLRDGPSG